MCGSVAIGIRIGTGIDGTTVIGRVRRVTAPSGSLHATSESAITGATGADNERFDRVAPQMREFQQKGLII